MSKREKPTSTGSNLLFLRCLGNPFDQWLNKLLSIPGSGDFTGDLQCLAEHSPYMCEWICMYLCMYIYICTYICINEYICI